MRSHPAGGFDGDTHGRVHRHREPDRVGPLDVAIAETRYGRVDASHIVASRQQRRRRGCGVERLVAQLIARDK